VEGKNKEIKKKKVGARVWRKWQGKRGKKGNKEKKMKVCVWRRKKEGKKKKKIWIKK